MPSQLKEKFKRQSKKGAARYRLRANQIEMIKGELLKNTDKKHMCILITTANHSLNDSFISFDLATAFAEQGKNTLLIDANFQGAVLHRWLEEKTTFGLSNALHRGNVGRFIHPTKIKNLSFLPLGTPLINHTESWRIEKLEMLREQLKSISDVTIIESSSYLTYLEIQMLASICNEVIVVVKQHKDKKSKLMKLKRDMEISGINITGMIYQPH